MQTPRSETTIVTPKMAEDWLAHAMWERQRTRKEWHVERLATEILKGRFIAGTTIHFGILRGALKLINGQHCLAAIVKSAVPVTLTVLYTPVETDDELGQLYGRHDRHRGRTPHDVFFGMGLSERLELSEPETNAFGRAIKHILADFRRLSVNTDAEISMSLDHAAENMEEWAPVARTYFEIAREARVGMKAAYRRAPVVAIALVTLKEQPEKATAFWTGAVNDDQLHKHDPRRALNNFLVGSTSGFGSPVTYMRNVAKCWNRFFDNGEIQILRPDDHGKIGVTVKGTKYKAESASKVKGRAAKADAQMSLGEAQVAAA